MSGRAAKAAAKARAVAMSASTEATQQNGAMQRTLRRNNTSTIVQRIIADQFGNFNAEEC